VARFTSIKQIKSEATGFRSTSLWDGMRAVDGDYFCNLDDDDTIHPNHISSLTKLLHTNKDQYVAYSGCIQVQDEEGHYYQQINFRGPLGTLVKENRKLLFLDPFNMERMLHLENFVVSNAWLARKEVLEDKVLMDPRLIVSEDVYLYQLFLIHGDFLFSWRATANWHWRSTNWDNSTIHENYRVECNRRIRLRTQFFSKHQNSLTCLDVARPFVSYTWNRFPRIKAIFRKVKKYLAERQT
jgi:phosphoglycerol transferase